MNNMIRNIKLSRVLLFCILIATGIAGCKKDDGPIKKEILDKITEVPAVTTNIDPSGSAAIDILNPATFSGKFNITNYFPKSNVLATKTDIAVRKSNSSGTTVKVFKSNVDVPTTQTVTVADIEAIFGPIALGDNYDFAPDFYYNGQKFEAFPPGGKGTGGSGGPNNMPGYGEYARFSVICAYDPSIYEGDFEVVQDDFEEYAPGDVITLTRLSDKSFSLPYAPPSAKGTLTPAVVTVNVLNNNVTIPSSVVATQFYSYSNLTIVTGNGSFVSPCDETVTFSLGYSVSIGGWGGGFKLILKKKP